LPHIDRLWDDLWSEQSMEEQKIKDEIPKTIGPYAILESLGRGGMGEVFLAKDPSCERNVALKRIRPELNSNKTIRNRFLREAQVASALTHPSIIPIFSIQMELPNIYYTMPFVEGETLRQILRTARNHEKSGDLTASASPSIPALARIFLQVCEAVAYTHSKGILHRDLKPENIIVGKYGEVMILDWGIADFIDQIGKEEPLSIKKEGMEKEADLTRPGKITGTLAYMAPERLLGKSSSVQTDIYALGVILYQLLTLQLPFQRKTIAAFRKQLASEEMIDPVEMAPYREIPHQLAFIASKCLARSEKERYQSVEDLLTEVKNYIEGRPEWIFLGELAIDRNEDWQFQENILLAKHIAITRSLDVTEWAALMISHKSFANNLRLDAKVRMGSEGQGLGFLISVPMEDERKSLEEGYCLWLGSEKNPSCYLFRNNVQVMEVKGLYLEEPLWHNIRIEKIEDHLKLFIDGELKLSFASHLPLAGTHVGLLYKDSDFSLESLLLYDGSCNVVVNCLAVPNAFLSHKFYDLALEEYRRIGQCFPGRLEGREALFRAGLTLLEKGRSEKEEKYFHLALKEFEKLYRTPGAPLEYLGKSLVYAALQDTEEEAKCLELALRKFPKHPLLSMMKEHIIYRIHETSLNNREAAYRVILLALRHIPDLLENRDTRALLDSLQKHWEPLLFIEKEEAATRDTLLIAIQLAFWLKKIPILIEIAEGLAKEKPLRATLLANTLFCLAELGSKEEIQPFLLLDHPKIAALKKLSLPLDKITPLAQMEISETRVWLHLMRQALQNFQFEPLRKALAQLKRCKIPALEKASFDALEAWSYLLQGKLSEASVIFSKHPTDFLTQETSPLHFVFGVWIYMAQGPKAAFAYFSSVLDTPYPPTTALPSYFAAGRIDEKKGWSERAFWWEKQELYRQIELFYKAVGKNNKKSYTSA
jgi:serine/threonine protein kinase/tetratricopeptide (TPR) repeat protein